MIFTVELFGKEVLSFMLSGLGNNESQVDDDVELDADTEISNEFPLPVGFAPQS